MNFFDKLLQIILNEDRLDVKDTDTGKVKSEIKEVIKQDSKKSDKKRTMIISDFEFIFNTEDDEVDINKNEIVIIDDNYIDIKQINVDTVIDTYNLAIMSSKIHDIYEASLGEKFLLKKKKLDYYIKFLEDELDTFEEEEEENSDNDGNYRDKDKEQRQKRELKKMMEQSKFQVSKKKLIIKILLLLKKKKDLWGVITSERNLNREVGGFEVDYELEAKIKNLKSIKHNKMSMDEWHKKKSLPKMMNAPNKMIIMKRALTKLSSLLGKRVALKLIGNMVKKNSLNMKNLNKVIKKVIALKKKMELQLKKVKNHLKNLQRKRTDEATKTKEEKINEIKKLERKKSKGIDLSF
jgi:hypothetical protein